MKFCDFYPVSLNIVNKKCIVIGGEKVAERKLKNLLKCARNCKISLVSPKVTSEIKKMLNPAKSEPCSVKSSGCVEYLKEKYFKGCLKDAFIVFAATNDPKVDQKIYSDALELKILCCRVDDKISILSRRPQYLGIIIPLVFQQAAKTRRCLKKSVKKLKR